MISQRFRLWLASLPTSPNQAPQSGQSTATTHLRDPTTTFRPVRIYGTSSTPIESVTGASSTSDDEVFSTFPSPPVSIKSPDTVPYSPTVPRRNTPIIPLSPISTICDSPIKELTASDLEGYCGDERRSLEPIRWSDNELGGVPCANPTIVYPPNPPAPNPATSKCCANLLPSAPELIKMLEFGKERISFQEAMAHFPQLVVHDLACPAVNNLYLFHQGTNFPNFQIGFL